MKRLLATLLVGASLITPAFAFYQNKSGPWTIFGHPQEEGSNKACAMEYKWQDGSRFQLVKDLVDGEVYMWFRNHQWDMNDEPGTIFQATMTFYGSRGSVESFTMNGAVLSKNEIVFPQLKADAVIPPFMRYAKVVFYMPGTVPNAEIELRGTSKGIDMLIDCMEIGSKGQEEDKAKKLGQEI